VSVDGDAGRVWLRGVTARVTTSAIARPTTTALPSATKPSTMGTAATLPATAAKTSPTDLPSSPFVTRNSLSLAFLVVHGAVGCSFLHCGPLALLPPRAICSLGMTATFIIGTTGRIRDANDAACRLLGYSRSELQALHGSQLVPPAERGVVAVSLDRMWRGEVERRSGWLLRKDRTAIFVDVTAHLSTSEELTLDVEQVFRR
jgi:PAS domain S-box-containing protein